jgi:hypothetical protein
MAPESEDAAAAPRRERARLSARLSSIGASAQAAIPGLYAWSITVAPAAWSRGGPLAAKLASLIGLVALVTAPLVEGAGPARATPDAAPSSRSVLDVVKSWTGPVWARLWSVWGFVLSSAIVWALVPGALSVARLDAVRGVLGMIGWALFAFASAGPALRADPEATARIVAGATLKPRSELPRGDIAYVCVGLALAFGMQVVGWGIVVPERAVLVRLVTLVTGMAVLGATTSVALARHAVRTPAPRRLRLRRALPWVVLLALLLGSGLVMTSLR